MKMVPEETLEKSSSPLNAAAHAAYEAITQFRKKEVHSRIKCCISWLQNHMREFRTLSVDHFGSYSYHLELCSSDADVVVMLANGESTTRWLNQLAHLTTDTRIFTGKKSQWLQRLDCLQTEFLGGACGHQADQERS